MCRMGTLLYDAPGLVETPCAGDVRHGTASYNLLEGLWICSRAAGVPHRNAVCQHALDGGAIEGHEQILPQIVPSLRGVFDDRCGEKYQNFRETAAFFCHYFCSVRCLHHVRTVGSEIVL